MTVRFPTADIGVDELAGPDAPAALARLRATAPVAWVPALDGWLVTTHALGLAVMRDAARFTVDDPRFSTARVVGASMLSTDGAEHRRHRQPFAPPFRAAELEARFGAEVTRLADDLVARLRPCGTADLRTELAGPLSVAVVAYSLGIGGVDAGTVLGWYEAIVAAVTALSAGRATSGTETAAVAELGDAVRRGFDTPSLLQAARGPLADDDIVANAAVMMFGGIETTEGMIANCLVHLLREPGFAARVAADPRLWRPAVEESLRLEPAAAAVDRYATTDVELGATSIPAGDLVRVCVTAANRDPAVFERPDEFALDRADIRSQLAFARGPHACIAMDLARLETVAALRAAFTQLPGLRLTGSAAAEGLIFRKPASVPVAWGDAVA